jgi:hypothetical protein
VSTLSSKGEKRYAFSATNSKLTKVKLRGFGHGVED